MTLSQPLYPVGLGHLVKGDLLKVLNIGKDNKGNTTLEARPCVTDGSIIQGRDGDIVFTDEVSIVEAIVDEVLRRYYVNEYKRRQLPPAIKVTPKAFGIGRRVPITQAYRD